MSAEDDNDDIPCMSSETFTVLQEFYLEQAKREEIIARLQEDEDCKENILFSEDWQLSQFWYDEKTIQSLVKVLERILPQNGTICLMCSPTLYTPVKKMLKDNGTVKLFEFDRRFEVYGSNFIHYDFNYPLKIPPDCEKFDVVIADPPFLSEECLTKTSETIKALAKDKIILCTGAIMQEVAEKLLDLKVCKFKPGHRNNLANEFSCYANFNLDYLLQQS